MARVGSRKMTGSEPHIPVNVRFPLEFHGNDYCGWSIPVDFLNNDSIIVDVGVGEDISFTQSLVARYGCKALGFDPTPRAAAFIEEIKPKNFVLHKYGLADKSGKAKFNLPTNADYVSGSLVEAKHLEGETIEVDLVDMSDLMALIKSGSIDILKIDIEGAEYALLDSQAFADQAISIRAICIEFHHRWPEFGVAKTRRAVERLQQLGFDCAWGSRTTNEEFLFVRNHS
jgi:FkbM family methyltransferase